MMDDTVRPLLGVDKLDSPTIHRRRIRSDGHEALYTFTPRHLVEVLRQGYAHEHLAGKHGLHGASYCWPRPLGEHRYLQKAWL